MNIYKKIYQLILALSFFILPTTSWATDNFTKAPRPEWVRPAAMPDVNGFPQNKVQDGVYYLLTDVQVKVDEGQDPKFYYHFADYIVNQAGVETSSQINIGYYSEYQKLTIHTIRLIRNGEVINKIDSARMNVVLREDEMSDLLYTGQKTLNIILNDVRVGDTIEYSYSRDGINPVYKNIFSYNHYLNWEVPVGRLAFRLLWNKPKELQYRVDNSKLKVVKSNTDSGSEYVIRSDAIEPVKIDKNTPSWYNPWGTVHFSEVKSWADVVRWSKPLYQDATLSDEKIEALALSIEKNHKEKKQQISAALRFVQDDIRYLGIELGQNTHKPTPAFKTLRNRYGDCKDKTVLFITLLDDLGIKAYPVLVNTETKLNDAFPSTLAFDHVITYLEFNGKKYWLDPTRKYQYGDIDSIHQPDYGMALVLRPGNNGLTTMSPRGTKYGVFVKDSFVLHKDNTVDYTTITENRGWNAEQSRKAFADKGRDKLQSEYLEFFQRYYPGINVAVPVTYEDDVEHDIITTTERYRIDDFWEDNQKKRKHYAYFYSNIVSSPLKVRDEPSRNSPLYLTHPEHIKQVVEVTFEGGDWYFDDEKFVEDNDFFLFEDIVKYDKNKHILTLSYTYYSKTDNVPANRYQDYLADLKKVDDHKNYSIYKAYRQTPAPIEAPPWYKKYINVTTVLILLSGMYALVFILWRIERYRYPDIGEATFYPVSIPKLIAMWIFTFGIYGAYWFYRNFKYIKLKENNSSMPIARGVFNVFWYYPLWKKLKEHNERNHKQHHIPGKLLATCLALLFFVTGILGNSDSLAILTIAISAFLVLPLANYILHTNNSNTAEITKNSRWQFRHFLLAIVSTPLMALSVGTGYGIMPSDTVEKGSWLLDKDIKMMQRNGLIKPDDHIAYFYSDAIFSVGDDGNGFTQRHAFSYWKDDDGKLRTVQADYRDIKDIKVNWNRNLAENTTITIVKKDDSEFIMYVSNNDKKDRIFVNELKRRWKNSN